MSITVSYFKLFQIVSATEEIANLHFTIISNVRKGRSHVTKNRSVRLSFLVPVHINVIGQRRREERNSEGCLPLQLTIGFGGAS